MPPNEVYRAALARLDELLSRADSWWNYARHRQVAPYKAARDYVAKNIPPTASDALFTAGADVLDRLTLIAAPELFHPDGSANNHLTDAAVISQTLKEAVEAAAGPVGGPIVEGVAAFHEEATKAAAAAGGSAGKTFGELFGLTNIAIAGGVVVLIVGGVIVYRAVKPSKKGK